MANKIMQIRYYGADSDKNSDTELNTKLTQEIVGNIVRGPIVSLGIQTSLPGLSFYINNSERSVIVGISGIYELNLSDLNKIYSLVFAKQSINAINNGSHYLIIDILYEDEGGSTL